MRLHASSPLLKAGIEHQFGKVSFLTLGSLEPSRLRSQVEHTQRTRKAGPGGNTIVRAGVYIIIYVLAFVLGGSLGTVIEAIIAHKLFRLK